MTDPINLSITFLLAAGSFIGMGIMLAVIGTLFYLWEKHND